MRKLIPPSVDHILLTGATGAVGQEFLAALADTDLPIICLVRSADSAERVRAALRPGAANRVRVVMGDLRSDQSMAGAEAVIGRAERRLVLHCAADVSWTKPRRMVEDLNVAGSLRLAELAIATSARSPLFVFVSTAFIGADGGCRNAYEATKLEAEQRLIARLGGGPGVAIVRCSLITGRADTGRIGRFNGIYPLIRILTTGEVPCLIAKSDYRIDLVPVDTVVAETLACARTLAQRGGVVRSVVAAGDYALPVDRFLSLVIAEANRFRAAHSLAPLPEISVIGARQFRFLMSAAKSWDMQARFARVEQISAILDGYIAHGESHAAICPEMLTGPPPDPARVLPVIARYWMERNSDAIRAARAPVWLTGEVA